MLPALILDSSRLFLATRYSHTLSNLIDIRCMKKLVYNTNTLVWVNIGLPLVMDSNFIFRELALPQQTHLHYLWRVLFNDKAWFVLIKKHCNLSFLYLLLLSLSSTSRIFVRLPFYFRFIGFVKKIFHRFIYVHYCSTYISPHRRIMKLLGIINLVMTCWYIYCATLFVGK